MVTGRAKLKIAGHVLGYVQARRLTICQLQKTSGIMQDIHRWLLLPSVALYDES